jgi:hypothetical protein
VNHDIDAPEEQPGAPVARNSTLDAIVAACLMVVALVVIVEARRLGAGWTTDGPGAGYFPFYVGLVLLGSGAAIFVGALRRRRAAGDDDGVFVDRVQLRRVLSVLLPSAVYVAAIMVLGLYVASAIFIAVFMVWLGKYKAWKSVVTGIAVMVFFFVLFEVWFKVPLYKGALDLLGFLGY